MAATLFAVNKGFLDDVDVKKCWRLSLVCISSQDQLCRLVGAHRKEPCFRQGSKDEAELTQAITAFKKTFA